MTVDESVALGVKVFSRTEKLETLLESARDAPITHVYVADDGHTKERRHLYERSYPFELTVLDLPYDAGLGDGRSRIVEALDEPYVLMTDSDHEIFDIDPLYAVLSGAPELGGVGGLMYKNEGEIQVNCADFYESGDVLVRDIRGEKALRHVEGYPLVEFDYIPNAALYRRECLEAYSWDRNYVIGKDHLDFYLGHKKRTDWRFGLCPMIVLGHHSGGDSAYLMDRLDTRKTFASKRYFLEKWGYDQIVTRRHWSNMSADDGSVEGLIGSSAKRLSMSGLGVGTQRRLIDLHDVGMRMKARLYEWLREPLPDQA